MLSTLTALCLRPYKKGQWALQFYSIANFVATLLKWRQNLRHYRHAMLTVLFCMVLENTSVLVVKDLLMKRSTDWMKRSTDWAITVFSSWQHFLTVLLLVPFDYLPWHLPYYHSAYSRKELWITVGLVNFMNVLIWVQERRHK